MDCGKIGDLIFKLRKEYQKIYNCKNDAANKVVSHILSYKNVYMQDTVKLL